MNVQPKLNRRSLRLPEYNYARSGAYFITIVTAQRACLFGVVSDGEVHLSDLGRVADEEWQRTSTRRSNVTLDEYVIMPNRIHALLWIENDDLDSDPERRFGGQQAGSLSAIVGGYKAAVTSRLRELTNDLALVIWQRNYHERVVRRTEALEPIRLYVRGNPEMWPSDEENPANMIR